MNIGVFVCGCNESISSNIDTDGVAKEAESYIDELKRFDVPTSTAHMGGLSITLSVPKAKSEMRIHSCPSCWATLDYVAVCGQVVNNGVFVSGCSEHISNYTNTIGGECESVVNSLMIGLSQLSVVTFSSSPLTLFLRADKISLFRVVWPPQAP